MIEEEKKYKQLKLDSPYLKNRYKHINLDKYKLKLIDGRISFTKP